MQRAGKGSHPEVHELARWVVASDVGTHGMHPRLVEGSPQLGSLACNTQLTCNWCHKQSHGDLLYTVFGRQFLQMLHSGQLLNCMYLTLTKPTCITARCHTGDHAV